MKFSKNELNVICQNAAPTKAETLAGIKEIVSVTADLMTKLIMENAIRRLERIPEPECSQFIASVKAQFPTEQNNNSIRQRLAAAKAQEQILQGHSVLVASVAVAGNLHTALWSVAAYTVILCFSLFKTGSLSKSVLNAH